MVEKANMEQKCDVCKRDVKTYKIFCYECWGNLVKAFFLYKNFCDDLEKRNKKVDYKRIFDQE